MSAVHDSHGVPGKGDEGHDDHVVVGEDPGTMRVVAVLRDLASDQVELISPPADLWSRISDALDADAPQASAGSNGGAGTVVEYRIDADDVVVSVGADWDDFARENEADELVETGTGRTLWSSIGDDSLRELWREAVRQARSTGNTVTVPFRCDGPCARRWFDMTVEPLGDGAVAFRSELVMEMPRPELAVLHREMRRNPEAGTVEICSWCNQVNDEGHWRPVEELLARTRLLEQDPPPPVAHGICPHCVQQMSTQLIAATS